MPGFALHDELELLVAAGLSPRAALATATTNPARYLELMDSHGEVRAGKVADLVILDANPLIDIRHTRGIHAVIVAGRLIAPAARLEMLERIASAAAAPP